VLHRAQACNLLAEARGLHCNLCKPVTKQPLLVLCCDLHIFHGEPASWQAQKSVKGEVLQEQHSVAQVFEC